MRSAGLRNITARHLALASQSLSIIVAFIPYLREGFRRHLDTTQYGLLPEFDKLKVAYQEHQNEIHSKLISIMGERLVFYCRSLSELQWDTPTNQTDGQIPPSPNTYMQGLMKETVTLHKVLSKYLGPSTTEPIMLDVFASINHRLSEEFQKIPLPSLEAKEQMLADARFFHEKLSTLPGVNFPSTMLETVVQEKPVMRRSVLNPNGVPVSGPSEGDSAGDSAPRPRGSIDLHGSRSSPRQSNAGTSGPAINNIAARPSPFARRAFGNLFGGANANSSNASQVAPPSSIAREGSPTPVTPQTQGSMTAIGSSGPATPELEPGRASPSARLSPPHTPAEHRP